MKHPHTGVFVITYDSERTVVVAPTMVAALDLWRKDMALYWEEPTDETWPDSIEFLDPSHLLLELQPQPQA